MRDIPLAAVPTQTAAVVLDGQAAQIQVRQNGPYMYFDLQLGDQPIVTTRICRDRQLLLVDARYRGFKGDFMFLDTQGESDPRYNGLGSRYRLVFLSASELP